MMDAYACLHADVKLMISTNPGCPCAFVRGGEAVFLPMVTGIICFYNQTWFHVSETYVFEIWSKAKAEQQQKQKRPLFSNSDNPPDLNFATPDIPPLAALCYGYPMGNAIRTPVHTCTGHILVSPRPPHGEKSQLLHLSTVWQKLGNIDNFERSQVR